MTTANQVLWDDELGVVVNHTEWFPGLLETVAYLHNTGQHGPKDLRVLMHVPGVVIEDWCIKQRISFDDFTRSDELRRRFLNDPDLSLFRVWKGRA
jgi:hypothetical protein